MIGVRHWLAGSPFMVQHRRVGARIIASQVDRVGRGRWMSEWIQVSEWNRR